jgi:PAS domain S-box-containing protein
MDAIVHKKDLGCTLKTIAECAQKGKASKCLNLRTAEAEGQYYRTNWEVTPLIDDKGSCVGVLGIGPDIGEEKRGKLGMEESKSSLKSIFDSSTDAYVFINEKGKVTTFNHSAVNDYEDILSSEALQRSGSVTEVFPSEIREELLGFYQCSKGKRRFVKELRVGEKWYKLIVYPISKKEGNPSGTAIQIAEITSRKKAEEYQKALLKGIPDSLCILSTDGMYIDFLGNDKHDIIDPEQARGKHISSLVPEDTANQVMAAIDRCQSTRSVAHLTFSLQVNEEIKHFEGKMTPLGYGQVLMLRRDVTPLVNAMTEVENQQALLRSFYQSTSEGMTFIDTNFKFRFVNKKAKEFSKMIYGREAKIGEDALEYTKEGKRERIRKLIVDALEGNRVKAEGRAGEWVWEFSLNPVESEQGEVLGISFITRDISDERKDKDKLAASEEKYRSMVKSLSEGIVVHAAGQEGKIVEANDAAARILGISMKQLLGTEGWGENWKAFSENGKALATEQFPANITLRTGKRVHHYVIGLQREEEELAWLLVNTEPIFDGEGAIENVLAVFSDITELKNAQLAAENSEHKLQRAIEAIPHPLLIVNEKNEIEFINEYFENVFGYESREVLGKHINMLIPERFRSGHDQKTDSFRMKGSRMSEMGRFLPALTKAGEEITVSASLNVFNDSGKSFVMVILQDVTEFKKTQDRIVKQNENLKSIAWTQSHELRKPLANMMGLCDLILEWNGADATEVKDYSKRLKRASVELDSIVREIVRKTDEEF